MCVYISRSASSVMFSCRFRPEAEHSANAGLHIARELLEPIKKKYPWISYSDLWTLAGCVAVEELGGMLLSYVGSVLYAANVFQQAVCWAFYYTTIAMRSKPHANDTYMNVGSSLFLKITI